MEKITFVIPTRNNLEFLKLAYESIRNLKTQHEIIILDDASEDGTMDWVTKMEEVDGYLERYTNPGNERIGIVGMFDKGIEMATTNIIMAFHADMVVCKDFDVNILKHLKRGTIVSATRVEPPLHPEGPEKIISNFGIEVEDFNINGWLKGAEWLKEDKTTEGIFAPWCMYKQDFLYVGGHDELFAPQSKEDSDLFNRFMLKGYKFIQSWDALVYHFTSRGSRFNKLAGGAAGVDSPEWIDTTTRNMRNFVRKWGTIVQHDKFMKPVVSPKYDIGIVLYSENMELLKALEPFCNTIYTHEYMIEDYIKKEQSNTSLNLKDRVKEFFDIKTNDVLIEIFEEKFTQTDFKVIQQLPDIIKTGGEIGEFELGNLKITIHKMKEYQDKLINCNFK